jgi:hypothetical protein
MLSRGRRFRSRASATLPRSARQATHSCSCATSASEAAGADLRGTFRALLATTKSAASARVDPTSTYVRPDGQVVGIAADLLATNGDVGEPFLESGVWQQADGQYTGENRAITGAPTPASLGTVTTTCDDWSNSSEALNSTRGFGAATASNWWDGASVPCSMSDRIYCIEQ